MSFPSNNTASGSPRTVDVVPWMAPISVFDFDPIPGAAIDGILAEALAQLSALPT